MSKNSEVQSQEKKSKEEGVKIRSGGRKDELFNKLEKNITQIYRKKSASNHRGIYS